MKVQALFLLSLFPLFLSAQEIRSMSEVEERKVLSMGETYGNSSDGVYRYYAKGEKEAFTGILYAKYPNGNTLSWQEYVDGLGQGQFINYYENGNFKEIGTYEQNRVEGPIRKFHPNGEIQAVGTYKDWRIKVNTWRYYDTEGRLIETVDYGEKGSIEEVNSYYERGDIPYSWYSQILRDNGF